MSATKKVAAPGPLSHPHIGDVPVAQVQFGNAAGSFQDDRAIAAFQAVESFDRFFE